MDCEAKPVVYSGMSTPWGKAQGAHVLAPGIGSVSTAGHGGVKVDRAHNAAMPEYMRRAGGWYEEDCDWCLPFVCFGGEILKVGEKYAVAAIQDGSHYSTLKNWHPAAYERFTGVELKPGESYMRDKELFEEAHKGDMVSVSASGDWHEDCPKGFVLVTATRGGGRYPDDWKTKKTYLVPAEEYKDDRHRFGFVIDEARHNAVAVA